MLSCNILSRIKLLFTKDREFYAFCFKLLGFYPGDIRLYHLAFVHRSLPVKLGNGTYANNERLEYLGDAILDAIIADMLYRMFPRKREGFLTSTRSKIVKRESLNKIGIDIGLEAVVRSASHTLSHNSYIYGNAVEALVGAVYLDRGYDKCKRFVIERIIKPHININSIAKTEINFKSRLIEWGQKYHIPIKFDLIETSNDGHNSPIFRSAVFIGDILVSEASGYTKKESHQIASKIAYHRVSANAKFREEIFAAFKPQMTEEHLATTAGEEQLSCTGSNSD